MNQLIVRLSALLLLTACCEDNDADCTTSQLAVKVERNHSYELQQAAITTPQLISVTDNVKLYRIWTLEPNARDH